MRKLALISALLAGTPAMASSGSFVSLANTNFVVLISFILFVALLIKLKVPGMLGGLLDKRADGIKSEIDEARELREEAQTLLASYERKQKEVQAQADRIVETAKHEAAKAAEEAKADLAESIKRRLAGAIDQIASAEASAVREVRDQAITIAIGAANDVITKQMTAASGNALIEDAIADVKAKLH